MRCRKSNYPLHLAANCSWELRRWAPAALSLAAPVARTVRATDRINSGDTPMSVIKTKDGTEIFYKDWGKGQPIVFSHGWPLSADDWDAQMMFFLSHGYRVIAHDRRGHG